MRSRAKCIDEWFGGHGSHEGERGDKTGIHLERGEKEKKRKKFRGGSNGSFPRGTCGWKRGISESTSAIRSRGHVSASRNLRSERSARGLGNNEAHVDFPLHCYLVWYLLLPLLPSPQIAVKCPAMWTMLGSCRFGRISVSIHYLFFGFKFSQCTSLCFIAHALVLVLAAAKLILTVDN
jgi:hypothetical protein